MFARLRPLFPYLKRYRTNFIWGGLAIICSNAVWIFFPQIIRRAIDSLSAGATQKKIFTFAALLILIAVLKGIFLYLMRWIIIGISRDIEFDLRNDLFLNLERQPPSYFQENRTGDIMARMTNDLNAVRMLLGPAIMYSANTILFTVGALGFMLHISVHLTLLAFAPLPLASIVIQYFGRRIHERFERIQAMYSDISAQVQENLSGARLIRAFVQEDAENRSFATANREYIRRALKLVQLMGMLWPTLEFMLGTALVIVLLVGGRQVLRHQISIGDFVAFNTYMMMLTWPVIALGWVINLFQRGTASVQRIHEILSAEPAIDDSAADATLADAPPVHGDIAIRSLTFSYGPQLPNVLTNINLHIPAGTSLAIVGPTGSGKSTLVSLIARLQDAAPDAITIDDRSVREYPLATLRRNIGFVPQETFLFSETIRENIAFGVSEATDHEVFEAAEAASIANEILEFPRGFATMVGERGITLSGGQKQRTAIARALIRQPRILILDDALSSVDTYTEERILEQLRMFMTGRTTIFISHRVSTARSADQIAVLVEGRIVERGTHEELITRGGYYTRLHEKQMLEEELTTVG